MDLVEVIRERFYYQDGRIFVKKTGQWKGKVGDEAGTSTRKDGRRIIQVCGKRFFTHQIVWLMFHDSLPDTTIDHKDRDCTNNKIENLRSATRSEQQVNKRLSSQNTSGYRGVSFRKQVKAKPWRATVGDIHLGYYATAEEAARAYDEKALEVYGEFACLNFKE